MQKMKQWQAIWVSILLVCSGVIAIILLSTDATVSPSGHNDVILLENNHSAPLYFVYAARTGNEGWSADLLKGDVLLPGERISVPIQQRDARRYRAIDVGGRKLDTGVIRPGQTHRVVFNTSMLAIPEEPGRELGWIKIRNFTEVALHFLYASPVYADHWTDGDQLFESGFVLLPNEEISVYIDTELYQTTLFDVLAEDVDGNRYIHWDINLQLTPELEFRIQDIR